MGTFENQVREQRQGARQRLESIRLTAKREVRFAKERDPQDVPPLRAFLCGRKRATPLRQQILTRPPIEFAPLDEDVLHARRELKRIPATVDDERIGLSGDMGTDREDFTVLYEDRTAPNR